jgi:hypothetical protein
MAEGRKRALRLLPTEEDAKALIASSKDASKLTVQARAASRTRCQDYCLVRSFCDQKKREDIEQGTPVEEPEE